MAKGGSTTQTTTQEIPGFIQDQVKEVFDAVESFTPSSNFVPSVAGFTPNQTLAQTLIKDLATGSPLASSKTALDNIITGEFSVSDPLQRVLDDTISKTVDDVTSQYSTGGRLGSDAFGTSLGEGIASGVAPTLAKALESDASRKISAVGMLPSVLGSELGLLGALSAVGKEEQAMDQSLLNKTAQDVAAENQSSQQKINNLIAALGGAPTPTSTTQSSSPSNLDAALAIALGLGALSDKRLKVDIKKIGIHSTGLNVYEWEWNAKAFVLGLDKHPRKGFIAQEVQKVFPEAVVEGSHGYLMIDYSKIKEVA
tara:strand:+ start:422 stop:1357 length:936 start_codon:yes stop_codon:yes gene_type:complete